MKNCNTGYTDVFLRHTPEPVYCYRSGLAVYEERFVDGTLISGGWNAAGYPLNVLSNFPTHIDCALVAEPSVFHVELDGETVDFYLEEQGMEVLDLEDGTKEAVLTLKSRIKPVQILVHTLLDGTPVLTRWLEIRNLSDQAMALSRLSILSGALEQMKEYRQMNPDLSPEELYELGYFDQDGWGWEGDFSWKPLPFDKTGFAGRFGRRGFRHPAFFLKNKLNGQIFFGQMAWSAGYECSFDYMAEHESQDVTVALDFALTGFRPLRILEGGECYISPAVHVGLVLGDLDDAVNASYDHIRRSVLTLPEASAKACLVGSGMGPEHDMSLETSKRFADQMSQVGCEVFIVDAGWYCPPNKETQWLERAGNWKDNPERYPGGIMELREYVHSKGMKFGMWMASERIGELAPCYEEHKDWYIKRPLGNTTPGVLDFSNPEAAAWAEEQVSRVITEYELDLFRIDLNFGSEQYFFLKEGGRWECGTQKHYEGIYAMYERLKKRFPDVIFENCAGGGERTDLGMLRAFNHSWVSDWQKAPRSLYITAGMTLVLPPERVDRLVAGMGCHAYGSLDFQMRNAMLGHMSINVFSPAAANWNPGQLEFISHSIAVYKNFIRKFLPTARMYHHMTDIPQMRKEGLCALELASCDKSKAAISVFRLPGSPQASSVVRPRGIDRGKTYRVTFDNTGEQAVVTGWELAQRGVNFDSLAVMNSELLLLEAIS